MLYNLYSSFIRYCFLPVFLCLAIPGFTQIDSLATLQINITIKQKHVGDTLFVAGNFNNWNPHDINRMILPNKEGIYKTQLFIKKDELVTWKITRGSWDKVEVETNGNDVPNHSNTMSTAQAMFFFIKAWKDDFPSTAKQHTASPQVHIMDTAFDLKALGRKRKVWIYLPKDYARSNKKYPVLYMHDGQNLFDACTSGYGEWGVDELLDSIFAKTHKSMIVVGIDNLPGKRLQEYNPYDEKDYGNGEGKLYVKSLVEDLKPFVDKHYRTLPHAANTAIAGSSMGGIISLWAVMQYPKVFGNAGIFSPAFWVAPQFKTDVPVMMKNNTSRLFFYCGGAESKTMESDMDDIIQIVKANSKTSVIKKFVPGGQHNEQAWHLALPGFLSTIPFQ